MVPKEAGNLLVLLADKFMQHFFNNESNVLTAYVGNVKLKRLNAKSRFCLPALKAWI